MAVNVIKSNGVHLLTFVLVDLPLAIAPLPAGRQGNPLERKA
jgi:hypothetical protein